MAMTQTLEQATLPSPLNQHLPRTSWDPNHREISPCMPSGNAPEAPSSTSASVTPMPDPTPTPPPTKCWSAHPRRRSGSMNCPVLPNIKTSLCSATWRMDSHSRKPGKPSNALPAFLPPSGTAPTRTP
ncbi:hypothetical protein ACHAW6_002123 [Cyclotella cf. meneghiniana]